MRGNMNNNPFGNPVQLMQMFQQFASGYDKNPEVEGRKLIQSINLNQNQLNKIQGAANMVYGIAQRFGLIK